MKRFAAIAGTFVFTTIAGLTQAAQPNLTIDAFFGTFSGGGVAENEDSIYFATTARDFDVKIAPSGSGFQIDWTSVIRKGGDPKKPNVRRRQTTRTLVPAGAQGVFRCTSSGDPLKGKEMCGAKIKGATLSLFLMRVNKNGIYALQQYDRTLSGTGMKLVFKSTRSGERVRTVSGRLVKTAR
ncbi:MAG: hypothetical protein CMM52_11800 [Rhodospirillaceae bacterium]|nr:hypothetical protein [Rhodospirillaceae bacterium]|tara:strand:- start:21976 stop:22521 length:546 start_codon:yes stop_codon:yes gene_type:complete